jgi:transcriptional regulator with XRE-family HTH domain
VSDSPRAALAHAIRARRKDLGMTQGQLAHRADISVSGVQKLEDPTSTAARPRTLPKVEKALGWPAGAGDAILRGEEPPKLPAGRRVGDKPSSAPVGQGIDPEFLVELATSTPEQLQRVRDFLRGIKEGNS